MKFEMSERRQELFMQGTNSKIEEEEWEVELQKRMLWLKQREAAVKQAKERQEVELRLLQDEIKHTDVLSTVTDAQGRMKQWVQSKSQDNYKHREKLDIRTA